MVSRFENKEAENIDITGAYIFGERDFDKSPVNLMVQLLTHLAQVFIKIFREIKLNIKCINAAY